MADRSGIVVARYQPPQEGPRRRDGHHAHALRCLQNRSTLEASRKRIAQACTERASRVSVSEVVLLPIRGTVFC
jgi:hypothetical protein